MPVTHLHIKWPDNTKDKVYSPSSVIEKYFSAKQEIPVNKFHSLCSESLDEASNRVAQKFGFACTSAAAEKKRIQLLCSRYEASEMVEIVGVD